MGLGSILYRPRRRGLYVILTCSFLLGSFLSIYLWIKHHYIPQHHLHNGAYTYTPSWAHPTLSKLIPPLQIGPPTIFDEILAAPHSLTWPTPTLPKNVLLKLHIFSVGRESSRIRRQLIRQHSTLDLIPPEYRHLIEIKFILGYPPPGALDNHTLVEEKAIEEEMKVYGDIVRLEGLVNGDNMNNGKSWEWIRWVGGENGSRKGQWVMKCDDDTLPILPNLLDTLLSVDASVSTYIGTSLGRWPGYPFYFEGMMYGFTWNVVKSIAAAEIPVEHVQYGWDEDARIGSLMFSLPSLPRCLPPDSYSYCDPHKPPPLGWSAPPPSPDPRTGLQRIDLGNKLGTVDQWYITGISRAVGYHGLKEEERYLEYYHLALDHFRSESGEYLWKIPNQLRQYAQADPGGEEA